MVEINPFAEDSTEESVCLDTKLKFDDNAESDRMLDVAKKIVNEDSRRSWVNRHLTDHFMGQVFTIELSQGLLDQTPQPEGVCMERLATHWVTGLTIC